MEFKLNIRCDGSAFGDDDIGGGPEWELARLLRIIADRVENQEVDSTHYQTIIDGNGNSVGRYRLA